MYSSSLTHYGGRYGIHQLFLNYFSYYLGQLLFLISFFATTMDHCFFQNRIHGRSIGSGGGEEGRCFNEDITRVLGGGGVMTRRHPQECLHWHAMEQVKPPPEPHHSDALPPGPHTPSHITSLYIITSLPRKSYHSNSTKRTTLLRT